MTTVEFDIVKPGRGILYPKAALEDHGQFCCATMNDRSLPFVITYSGPTEHRHCI